MPHCIIEYADTVEQLISPQKLITIINQAAASSALFDENHIKTRAIAYQHFQVGQSDKAFIHVNAKILSGRTLEQRQHLTQTILGAIAALELENVSLTVEVIDMERASYAKQVT
ncbi:5-carboxymethyl-2-hydroxymuconate Delta-isomerase [Thalassotalea atypica]|uniref:5-carboxymethyl-2-hydroxymuconate Delta-isomerase n=1 Tax=Thalassotalea atypica TaxID=2054316 RepID=UPI0025727493|nr:5-carboxymethyl-2-hydroxymuconate Delta-isomerase [Thalassotalea atypica]